jgi:excisionase family DNA binding protein
MTDEKTEEKFYRVGEIEKMLSVSKTTLKRWIKDKKIKAVKFGDDVQGNPWRISESALAEFKQKNARYNTDGGSESGS